MNNEQTKTPEEVLYQAITDLWPTTLRSWEYLQEETRKIYRHAASSVISHVLQGGKYILLPENATTQEGDEKWFLKGRYGWTKISQPGWKVFGDAIRRPISLPSGNSEGTSPAQCASSCDAGADVPAAWVPKFKVGDRVKMITDHRVAEVTEILGNGFNAYSLSTGTDIEEEYLEPAPWQLPPPPTGQQWHRTDGWTQDMLPEGWRPLLADEYWKAGDMTKWTSCTDYKWREEEKDAKGPASEYPTHLFRTRRPLPQSAEPVVEEKPALTQYWQDTAEANLKEAGRERARAEKAESERDQLRKELEKATREVPRLEAELAGCGRQLGDVTRIAREQRERADSLTTENAALKERVKDESEQCVTYHNEITRLRSQFRWTPVPLEGITRTDEKNKLVVWVSDSTSETGLEWLHGISRRATHYISIESLRQFLPSPPETEEQAMRREFEEWARSSHELRHVSYELTGLMGNYVSSRLQDAWLGYQAAKQSTKEQA